MPVAPFGSCQLGLSALVAVSAILAISMAGTSEADDVKYVYSVRDRYAHRAKSINAPPVEKLLNKSQLKIYRDYLRNNKCLDALFLIRGVLDEINPISKNLSDVTSEWTYTIASKYYQEPLYCNTMISLNRYQKQIEKAGVRGWVFQEDFRRLEERKNPPYQIVGRNFAIASLLNLAFEDYAPAQLTLVHLSEKGEAIRLTKGFAYYLLARAKILGASDTDLDAMLEKAAAEFHPADRVKLDLIAAAGKWPRDKRLVMD